MVTIQLPLEHILRQAKNAGMLLDESEHDRSPHHRFLVGKSNGPEIVKELIDEFQKGPIFGANDLPSTDSRRNYVEFYQSLYPNFVHWKAIKPIFGLFMGKREAESKLPFARIYTADLSLQEAIRYVAIGNSYPRTEQSALVVTRLNPQSAHTEDSFLYLMGRLYESLRSYSKTPSRTSQAH